MAAARIEHIQELKAALRSLPKILRDAADEVIETLGYDSHKEIKDAYRHGGQPSALTQRKRALGKRAGKTPAVPARSPGPLFRETGAMINAVYLKKTKRGKVLVEMGFGQAGKGALLEVGATWSYTPTLPQWIYLRAIIGLESGGGELTPADIARIKRSRPPRIVVHLPPRPIWEPTIRGMIARSPLLLTAVARKHLAKLPFFR